MFWASNFSPTSSSWAENSSQSGLWLVTAGLPLTLTIRAWATRRTGLKLSRHSRRLWFTWRSMLQLSDRLACCTLCWMFATGPVVAFKSVLFAKCKNYVACVCECAWVCTSPQHRQDVEQQVGLSAGAKHAGKHQQHPTPAEGGPGGGQHTHSWNTEEYSVFIRVLSTLVLFLCEVSSPTKKTPAESNRPEVSGSLYAMPKKRTAGRSQWHVQGVCHVSQIPIDSLGVLPVPPNAPITGLSSFSDWLNVNLLPATHKTNQTWRDW